MESFDVETVFENADGETVSTLNASVNMDEAFFLLPVSFAGVVRMMMHPGDNFVFVSEAEKSQWKVTRTA